MKRASRKKIAADVVLGKGVQIHDFVNLYGCEIGDHTKIGAFVEIQKGAKIGAKCKISSHTFICEGVSIEDEVFVGHHVVFINDRLPRATNPDGSMKGAADWQCQTTWVRRRASIGSGAVILGGLTIGEDAMVGAGSVVTRDVPPRSIVIGNPAHLVRKLRKRELEQESGQAKGGGFSGRIRGKRITSRMDRESVSSMVRRSTPMPSPPVGGRP
jgi:acetyltransferase-like isoleucine patch superfamily enzyme